MDAVTSYGLEFPVSTGVDEESGALLLSRGPEGYCGD